MYLLVMSVHTQGAKSNLILYFCFYIQLSTVLLWTWISKCIPQNHECDYLCYQSKGSQFARYRPLTKYVRFRVAHAPGMPGTFSPPPRASDPDMHHGMCVTHVPWCMSRSLARCFLWSRGRGKRSRHSWRMHSPRFYASGKRPMGTRYVIYESSGFGSSTQLLSCCCLFRELG